MNHLCKLKLMHFIAKHERTVGLHLLRLALFQAQEGEVDALSRNVYCSICKENVKNRI